MRILFALPGLHRFNRGAEIAFISLANELAVMGEEVTLIGSGLASRDCAYRFISSGSVARKNFEAFPFFPLLRNEFAYEDLTFFPNLLRRYRPLDYDVTLTCSFPFTNFALRRPLIKGRRPAHVFVTENGDWPAYARRSETRLFSCEGLICTNPDYFERNCNRWRAKLIPNGVDCNRFKIGPSQKQLFAIPPDRFVVLMVSALDTSKRVLAGIEAVSAIPDAHMVVAGDGILRDEIDRSASKLLPGRYTRITVPPNQMPALYQSADVFLHLSRVESFGNVFLEAMACGLPIVGFDSPRTRWIVGDFEYFTSRDDPLHVAAQIQRAREETSEKRTARSLRALEFSWQNIAKRYQSFLLEVIEEYRKQ